MLHKLVFDATDATTQAASANVGAYLRASDGTLLTFTDVGGKKALDVRIAEGINVEVDLSAADDSVEAWLNDGSGNAISSTGGALHISDGGGSITVDAVNLDIRDLTHVSDSVKLGDGTDFIAINADGSLNITDNGGSITVDAVNLDIRDLTHASDSVKIGDGTDFLAIDGNGAASVSDSALANTAIATAANTLAVANTAEDLVASPLANRKYLAVYNNDNQNAYIGASGVTSANGFPVPPGSLLEMRAGAAIDIEFVSAKVSHEVRTLELS